MTISLAPQSNGVVAESDIEGAVSRYAESLGWISRKFNSPARRAEPDRIFFRDGRTVFIEFKRKGKKPTAAQRRRLDAYIDAGFIAVSCDDIDCGKCIFDLIEAGRMKHYDC